MRNERIKISNAAEAYGISTRTLRYYEEVGLIESVRSSVTQSRTYDPETLSKIKQIILLKQSGFSINEIKNVFTSREAAIAICSRKLKNIKNAEDSLQFERRFLHAFLDLLTNSGLNQDICINKIAETVDSKLPSDSFESERQIEKKERGVMKKLTSEEVRLITLNPMRVAYYTAVSEHPENDAGDVVEKWVKENGIDKKPHTRYFGYNTSLPKKENPAYGYEVCVTIEDDVQPEVSIGVKTLPGGLYAVSSLYGYDIPVAWSRLMDWISTNPYEPEWPARQCLEEHFPHNKGNLAEDVFQLDLYEPIKIKEEK